MNPQRPRPLTPADDTTGFDSGTESLDHYLAHRALANHMADLSRCYVSTDEADGRILGYYTLSAVAIHRAELPGKVRRNAPDPVPAVLLGRLAVDRVAQGTGLGRSLVRDATLSTLRAAESIGIRVLLVHAIDEPAAEFYRSLGFHPSPTDARHLHVLLADARVALTGSVMRLAK